VHNFRRLTIVGHQRRLLRLLATPPCQYRIEQVISALWADRYPPDSAVFVCYAVKKKLNERLRYLKVECNPWRLELKA
jgi:hypothetical protein